LTVEKMAVKMVAKKAVLMADLMDFVKVVLLVVAKVVAMAVS